MARQRFSDEDDDRDERPRDRRDDREDDDYDDRPRRRDRDDDYDDRPRVSRSKPGLATAAGVLWAIWAGFELIGVVSAGINLSDPAMAVRVQTRGPFGGALILDPDSLRQLTIMVAVRLVVNIAAFALFLVACIRTLSGGARSLTGFGIGTIVMNVVSVVFLLVYANVITGILTKDLGPLAMAGGGAAAIYGLTCGVGLLVVSGSLLAGIFALACNKKYTIWWDRTKGRSRRDYD